jgi:crotonobetainyl-CoA:carnitine CoA-transferase CaiB-like acyl-CoA transferase
MSPFKGGIPGIDRSAFATAFNTNKYGISLDLSKPKGREVAKRLVKWADVVADSMVPGTMAKWGLDYNSCRSLKPEIIYFSTTQHGQNGPYAGLAGYGMLASAMAGFNEVTGSPDRDPCHMYNNYTDFTSPGYIVIAIIGALLHRQKTGRGVYIEQAQIEAGLTFLGPAVMDYMVNNRIATRMGNRDINAAPHGVYRSQGVDRWIAIAVNTEDEWSAFCNAIGETSLIQDPKFVTLAARKKNEDELDTLVEIWTVKYSAEEATKILQEVGVPAGIVCSASDLFNDPQLEHRRHFRLLEHKVIGPHFYHAPAYSLSKTPVDIKTPGPCLGEHNDYVYKHILEYTDEEIADMLIEGVITVE